GGWRTSEVVMYACLASLERGSAKEGSAEMPTIERNLTDMLRSSGEVLREAEHQDVVLRRRDGADVMLVDFEREQGLRQSLAAAARIIAGLDGSGDHVLERF